MSRTSSSPPPPTQPILLPPISMLKGGNRSKSPSSRHAQPGRSFHAHHTRSPFPVSPPSQPVDASGAFEDSHESHGDAIHPHEASAALLHRRTSLAHLNHGSRDGQGHDRRSSSSIGSPTSKLPAALQPKPRESGHASVNSTATALPSAIDQQTLWHWWQHIHRTMTASNGHASASSSLSPPLSSTPLPSSTPTTATTTTNHRSSALDAPGLRRRASSSSSVDVNLSSEQVLAEKRRRNAGASARFRERRKMRERELQDRCQVLDRRVLALETALKQLDPNHTLLLPSSSISDTPHHHNAHHHNAPSPPDSYYPHVSHAHHHPSHHLSYPHPSPPDLTESPSPPSSRHLHPHEDNTLNDRVSQLEHLMLQLRDEKLQAVKKLSTLEKENKELKQQQQGDQPLLVPLRAASPVSAASSISSSSPLTDHATTQDLHDGPVAKRPRRAVSP